MTIDEQLAGARRFREAELATGRESISGPGSTVAYTSAAREWLKQVIARENIRSVADIPCGDYNWFGHIGLPPEIAYAGYDAVPEVVEAARVKSPGGNFAVANALLDVFPRADLILCRDFIVHLTLEHGRTVLDNFIASGSRYLAVTNFPRIEKNEELEQVPAGWGWRRLNMALPPFDLGPPLDAVCEDEPWIKYLALYRLSP